MVYPEEVEESNEEKQASNQTDGPSFDVSNFQTANVSIK